MTRLSFVNVILLVFIVKCLLDSLKASTTVRVFSDATLREGQWRQQTVIDDGREYVIFVGNRAEIIKTAPVVLAMKKANLSVHVVFTGEHPDIAAAPFRKIWDINFDTVVHGVYGSGQTLSSLTGNLVSQIEKAITPQKQHVWIVQGDTSTAFTASTVAFLRRTPVIHLDAGSRTSDDSAPFPDEFHRRATALATSAHIAPTDLARERLLQRGVHPERILVLGDSGMDATRLAQPHLQPPAEVIGLATRLVLVTLQRRDNAQHLHDLLGIIGQTPANINITFVVPVHPDPSATKAARAACSQYRHILCVAPLGYVESQWMLKHSVLIITDSGDLEEAATWYGRAVLVFSNATQRCEGIDAGSTMLVPNAAKLRNVLPELIQEPKSPRLLAMEVLSYPFGKGNTSALLVDYLQDPSFHERLAKPTRMTAMATAVKKYKSLSLTSQAATWQKSTVITYSPTQNESSVSSPRNDSAQASSVCSMEVSTDEKIWIAMTVWNDKDRLHQALRSVKAQSDMAGYETIRTVVFEDYSENMFTEQDKAEHPRSEKFEVIYMRDSEKIKKGSAFGKDRLFSYIGERALPHEYVLVMDGSDTFADDDTLQYIHEKLSKHKPWFAWGRHSSKDKDRCGDLSAKSWKDTWHSAWSVCHPQMFQSHILQHLDIGEFQGEDGTWLQEGMERWFNFKLLEIAGPERSLYLGKDRILYNNEFSNSNEIEAKEMERYTKSIIEMKQSPLGEDNVHVVACVFDRDNSRMFLQKLLGTKTPEDTSYPVKFHFHICNNKLSRQDELELLAESVAKDSDHTLTIHNMAVNMGGFARFLLAQRIMSNDFVNYIIMVDDDQYVFRQTLMEVYAQREPHTYKTWYGKNWNSSDEGKDYWKACKPITTDPRNRYKLHPEVKTWQYGGTGMSIIDASIFRVPQVFELEPKYMFLEDMWLSYIVQILGWRIERLFVGFRDPGQDYRISSGQFKGLYTLKNELFEKIGYLRCAPHNDEC